MWRMVSLIALAACASYRALPLETAAPGPSPLTLRYEQKRMNLFASTREDAQIEAVFASDTTIAALVSRPRDGVFVSTDGGSDWTFAPIDDRFSDMMFDGPLIVGRAAAHLHCSKDGGKTWRSWGGSPIEAAAVAGGAIYAAAGGHLYVSQDCAQSWKTLTPQIPGTWRARSIAVDRQSIYISVRATRETAPLTTLLDGSSDAAQTALSFVDGRGSRRPAGGDVWVTHDGGALWQRTSLALDAWVFAQGAEVENPIEEKHRGKRKESSGSTDTPLAGPPAGVSAPTSGVLAFNSVGAICKLSRVSRKIAVQSRGRMALRLVWSGRGQCRGRLSLTADSIAPARVAQPRHPR